MTARLCALLFAAFTSVSFGQKIQLHDRFNDGDRHLAATSGNEILPVAGWFQRQAGLAGVITLNGSNALQLNPTSATLNGFSGVVSNSQITAYFPLVTLADGESVNVALDLTFVGAALPDAATQFGLGLFNSNGTRDTADLAASSVARNDDTGYVFRYNPSGGATGANLAEKNAAADHFADTILGTVFGASWDTLSSTHRVTLTIKRNNAASLDISIAVDGVISGTTRTDTTPTATAFDTVTIFAANNTNNGFALDNITVTATTATVSAARTGDRARVTVLSIPDPISGGASLKVLRADTGTPLRAAGAWFFKETVANLANNAPARDPAFYRKIRDAGFNAIRLIQFEAWFQSDDPAKTTRYTDFSNPTEVAALLANLEIAVNLASDHGLYVILNPHTKLNSYQDAYTRAFWSAVAPYLKSRTHVLFELTNEPFTGPADFPDTFLDQHQSLYTLARGLAPATHIMLMTPSGISTATNSPTAFRELIDRLVSRSPGNIDWSNTSVAYHNYFNGRSNQFPRELHKVYPGYPTENNFAYDGVTPLGVDVTDTARSMSMDQGNPPNPQTRFANQTCEQLGTGWAHWHLETHAKFDGNAPILLNDAAIKGYAWSADPLLDRFFEAETLAVTDLSSGDTGQIVDDTLESGARGYRLDANAAGDQAAFTLPSVSAGVYQLSFRVRRQADRAMVQAAVDAGSGSFTTLGSPQDHYAAGAGDVVEHTLGTVSFAAAGHKRLRLAVTGKNVASTGYRIGLDVVKLTLLAPAPAPSGLAATAVSPGTINLAWVDSAVGETAYQVERSLTAGSGFTVIATLAANATSYSDAGLTEGVTYYYRVRATNTAGTSGYSSQASAATLVSSYSALAGVWAWENPAAWSPAGPPTAATPVTFTAAASADFDLNATRTVQDFTVNSAFTLTLNGKPAASALIVNGAFTKSGTASLTLGGWNAAATFNGPVTLNAGSFGMQSWSNGLMTFANGTTITLNGGTIRLVGDSATRVTSFGTGSITLGGVVTFNVHNFSNDLTRTLTGPGGFAKTGTGALVLKGANATYTGATTVSAGTLRMGAANVIGNSSAVTLSTGATLATNGQTETVGALTLTGGGAATLDFTGGGSLTFASSSAIPWAGTLAVVNFNPAADVLRFGNSGSGLASAQAAAITLNSSPVTLSADGTVSALPATPSNLAASTPNEITVNLTWTDNATNETSYHLERSLTAGGGFTVVATLAADTTAFFNAGLTPASNYYYRVRAVNASGASAYSSVIAVQTPAATPHNYAEAFQKSLFFFEAQSAGVLPDYNRVEWRGPSALRDGTDVGRDLTGGWYDAGDGVIWTSNDAFGATMLAWSLVDYRAEYISTGQYARGLDALRHGTDYLLKTVDSASPTGFRIYVGKGANDDHAPADPVSPDDHTGYWAHEMIDTPNISNGLAASVRPSYWVDSTTGGADAAGHVSAALASASIAFRQGGETVYANTLLARARAVFQFGVSYPNSGTATRRLVNGSIAELSTYNIRTNEWTKPMIYGAAWLHRAELAAGTAGYTAAYVDHAETFYNSANHSTARGKPWRSHATGDCDMGAYAMLAADTGRAAFVTEANGYANLWLYARSLTTDPTITPAGFVARVRGPNWNNQTILDQAPPLLGWADSARNTNATQKADLISLFTGTYAQAPVRQIDYILGDNPYAMSYLQGYAKPGYTWVDNLHYRGATYLYGGFGTPEIDTPLANTQITYGLLAPGPDHTDYYPLDRSPVSGTIIGHQEPVIYTGGLHTVLARRIRQLGAAAGQPLGVFPEWIQRPSTYQTDSFRFSAYRRTDSAPANGVRVVAHLANLSTLPVREVPSIGFRLYFNLDGTTDPTKVTMAGFWPQRNGTETCTWTGPIAAGGTLHYFEIRYGNCSIGAGEYNNWRRTVELSISQSAGTWDSSNDPSFSGLVTGTGTGSPVALVPTIPVYDFATSPAEVLGGFAPGAGVIRWRRATVANVTERAAQATLIAERVGGSAGAVSATYATVNETATAGADYTTTTGTLSWAAGQTGEKTVNVPLLNDSESEDRPSFLVRLSAPTGGATLAATVDARVYVEDDDFTGLVATTSTQIGAGSIAGTQTWNGAGTVTITGAGANALRSGSGSTADAGHLVWLPLTGDGSVTARLAAYTNSSGSANARAGVMIRESTATGSRYAAATWTQGNTASFLRRTGTGGTAGVSNVSGMTVPRWLRVVRTGNSLAAYQSVNGTSWTQIGTTTTVTMTGTPCIGFFVTSGSATVANTAVFDSVTIVQ